VNEQQLNDTPRGFITDEALGFFLRDDVVFNNYHDGDPTEGMDVVYAAKSVDNTRGVGVLACGVMYVMDEIFAYRKRDGRDWLQDKDADFLYWLTARRNDAHRTMPDPLPDLSDPEAIVFMRRTPRALYMLKAGVFRDYLRELAKIRQGQGE